MNCSGMFIIISIRESSSNLTMGCLALTASRRSVDLALIQYRDGVTDYTRVLDTQRALVNGQDSLADSQGNISLNLIDLYKALGGGWQIRVGKDFVPEEIKKEMRERTNWGGLLSPEEIESPPKWKPDW